jgi:hypothetical protein
MNELIDYVVRAQPLLRERDCNAWNLGDIIVEAVNELEIEIKPGRKKAGDDTLTLGDLAGALNQATPRVSEWFKNSLFFPSEVRPHNVRTYEDLTWGHFNLARRKSGGELTNAIELLETAVTLHLGYNAFKRWLNGEIWEGYLDFDAIPVEIKPFASPDRQVWATFKYPQE